MSESRRHISRQKHLVAASRMNYDGRLALADRDQLIGSLIDQYIERQVIMMRALRRVRLARTLAHSKNIAGVALAEFE